MILVLDVGNTNTMLGMFEDDSLLHSWRISTDRKKTSDELGMLFIGLINYEKLSVKNLEAVVISSVVPSLVYTLKHAVSKYFNLRPMVIGPGTKTGIDIKYENPKQLGTDRIANAVAAYSIYGGPVIVVDMGTATKICAISSRGEFLGGAICPGVRISADALFQNASKLPRVELVRPGKIIGRSTVTNMQTGIFYGHIGEIDFLVNCVKREMGEENIKVIATGGLAEIIAKESRAVDRIDSALTLKGLKIIYEKNKKECIL